MTTVEDIAAAAEEKRLQLAIAATNNLLDQARHLAKGDDALVPAILLSLALHMHGQRIGALDTEISTLVGSVDSVALGLK